MPKKLTPAQKEEQRKIRLEYAKKYYMANRDKLIKYAREKCKYANKRIYLEDDDPTKGKQFKKISEKDPDFSRSETQKAIVELPPKKPRRAPLPPKPLPPKPKKKIILKPPPSPPQKPKKEEPKPKKEEPKPKKEELTTNEKLKKLLSPDHPKFNKTQELLEKIGIINIYEHYLLENDQITLPFKFVKNKSSKCKISSDDLIKMYFNPKYDIVFDRVLLTFKNTAIGIHTKMKMYKLSKKYIYHTNEYKDWLNIDNVYDYVYNNKMNKEIDDCIKKIKKYMIISNYLHIITDKEKNDYSKKLSILRDSIGNVDEDGVYLIYADYYLLKNISIYYNDGSNVNEILKNINDFYRTIPIKVMDYINKLPKKEEPKEEQKEEPKEKEEVYENIKQFLDIQNELSSDKAHKYLSNDLSVKVYLLDILRRNNNDCYTRDQYGNILNEMNLSGQYSKILNVPKKAVEIIVDDYIRCKKKGKMILIPIGLKPSQSTGHANMLILNYHRNEIELFEPHGKKVATRKLHNTLQTFTDNFNKVLKIINYLTL